MAKWSCRYYYCATGTEGDDIRNQVVIEAPTAAAAKKIWLDRFSDKETRDWYSSCCEVRKAKLKWS